MDTITQWVKDNVFGMAESSIVEDVIYDYKIELHTNHHDYFTDLINESIEKIGAFEVFESIAIFSFSSMSLSFNSESKFIDKVFLADILKRIHDIEEQEEAEEEDNGIDNSDRLMQEHR